MRKLYIYLFLVLYLSGCKKETSPVNEEQSIEVEALLGLKLEVKNNPDVVTKDIICTINGDEITAVIPGIEKSNKSSLAVSFNSENVKIKVNGVEQLSGETINNFSMPLTYDVVFSDGTEKSYQFKVVDFTGLPIFHITSEAPVVSKDDYVNGSLTINTNSQFEEETGTFPLEIKGRGNSTWGLPKKPYRLKLKSKAKILGLDAAKNWVLLANYSDKTLMRTSFAFELGKQIGADFTPDGIPVEVVLNGQHLGSYLLTEQVEVNKGRVDITELKTEDTADKVTGGYLLEFDERLDEDFWFKTNKKLPFTIKSPDDINPTQLNYIRNYVQETENAIFSANFADPQNGYAKYINVNSFINWYLVQELVKNQDARNYSSIFYYKDRNGKLGMGPLWDFDLSMGNVNYSGAINPRGWWVRNGAWFNRLFQDPAFKKRVRDRWDEVKDKEIAEAFKNIDSHAAYLELSQRENFKRWDILNEKVWPNPQAFGTYEAEVNQIKSWLTTRIAWLDANL
jgi:spore coat protein CotH